MSKDKLTFEQRERIEQMEKYLSQSFDIDGDCLYIEDVQIKSSVKLKSNMMFQMQDSKKGIFYVTLSR